MIGFTAEAKPLLDKAAVEADAGVVDLKGRLGEVPRGGEAGPDLGPGAEAQGLSANGLGGGWLTKAIRCTDNP